MHLCLLFIIFFQQAHGSLHVDVNKGSVGGDRGRWATFLKIKSSHHESSRLEKIKLKPFYKIVCCPTSYFCVYLFIQWLGLCWGSRRSKISILIWQLKVSIIMACLDQWRDLVRHFYTVINLHIQISSIYESSAIVLMFKVGQHFTEEGGNQSWRIQVYIALNN